ncbi:MAG: EAL domain-containing protein [Thiofilum sp.]|uniref:EAL domain-containing protein n=1 Tax=Thiofilum sp. TaxID=2212733 RepID=UPI0025CB8F9F|nr:EAL domain-containing protein [Thiofilum sp.]MBK8454982.1 EAL domain-containing protein [Thiofilum sp.]
MLSNYFKQKLANKILKSTLTISFVITLISIFFIAVTQHYNETESILKNAKAVLSSQLITVSKYVWFLDVDSLSIQLQTMTSNESITYGIIYHSDGRPLVAAGNANAPFTHQIKEDILYLNTINQKPTRLGEIALYINTSLAKESVKANLLNIVLSQTIKAIIITLLFLWLTHKIIISPLEKIIDYIKNNLAMISSSETLILPSQTDEDELTVLANTIIKSKCQLDANYKLLQTQKEDLIAEIKLRHQAEHNEKHYSKQLMMTLNSLTDAVFSCTNDGYVLLTNKSAQRIARLSNNYQDQFLKKYIYELISLSYTQDFNASPINLVDLKNSHAKSFTLYGFCKAKNSNYTFPVKIEIVKDLTFKNAANENIFGFIVIIRDESDSEKLKEMTYNATHDALTHLYNRAYFNEQLGQVLQHPHDKKYTLAIIDLDKFKLINDTCGHQAGDYVLKLTAEAMKKNISSHDILARYGGDEFIILFASDSEESLKRVKNIIYEIENLNFTWGRKNLFISCSIGITPLYADDTLESVYSRADAACYQVKHDGGGVIQINYTSKPHQARFSEPFDALRKILDLIRVNNITLYAQPLFRLDDSLPHRIEILTRLKDWDNTILMPKDFIPLLEEYYYMPKFDVAVLKNLEHYIPQIIANNITININISPLTLVKPSHTQEILDLIRCYQLKPRQICFEITENTIIKHKDHVIDFMNEARKLGAIFALDDFGSGYASFGYLQHFYFDIIKIDGDLVKEIEYNETMLTMVKSIQSLAIALKAITVAEQANSKEAILILKNIGVHYIQSNYTYPVTHMDNITLDHFNRSLADLPEKQTIIE